ncbi:MAG: hypothetical protein M1308_06075 [Actinobacteria bacterium]|nr:hypothetical protein [Actinomycetota bacterium]
MLWSLTKWNHKLSTGRLVRWWLRATILDRVIMVIVTNFFHMIVTFFSVSLWLLNWGIHALLNAVVSGVLSKYVGESVAKGSGFILGIMNFTSWTIIVFLVILTIAVWAFSLFFIIDLIWDFFVTRIELRKYSSKEDIILATRGEYIGGHPNLPHSRFVYLIISGTQKNPYLGIILPTISQRTEFKIPLIDITSTKSSIDDKFGKPNIFNISLTSITPSIWKGYRSVIIVEYTSTGRKYPVELGAFLRGNDEVQMWKNYLTCTQSEADTNEKPYGQWESLPLEAKQES